MARRAADVYTEWRGGTCRVKWWTGEYHDSGRKRYESKAGFLDEDEAYEYGLDQMADIRHGVYVSNSDGATLMTDWLDEWLGAMNYAHLTERVYRSRVETHIRPYFKRKTVGEIDVIACRAFRKDLEKKLSKDSVKSVIATFGMIMDDAVPRLIRVSPIERGRRRGKYEKRSRERKTDVLPRDVESLAQNAKVLLGQTGYTLIWTMAMTGMRPGELYGLTREYCYPTWPGSDLHLEPDEDGRYRDDLLRYGKGKDLLPAIRVERQVQYQESELRFFPPKYHSARTLVIPNFLAALLDSLLTSHDSKWVFPAPGGGPLGSVDFRTTYWRQIADGRSLQPKPGRRRSSLVKIPEVPSFNGKRMYLIRHGHKAWLDEDMHSRFAVESRMGHEVPGVEGVYSSVTATMERAIMKTLQERWEQLQELLQQDPGA